MALRALCGILQMQQARSWLSRLSALIDVVQPSLRPLLSHRILCWLTLILACGFQEPHVIPLTDLSFISSFLLSFIMSGYCFSSNCIPWGGGRGEARLKRRRGGGASSSPFHIRLWGCDWTGEVCSQQNLHRKRAVSKLIWKNALVNKQKSLLFSNHH